MYKLGGKNLTKENSGSRLSTIERVGLNVDGANAAAAVETIAAAEAAGVQQIWMGQAPSWPDTLTTLAAAATKTSTVCLNIHCTNINLVVNDFYRACNAYTFC